MGKAVKRAGRVTVSPKAAVRAADRARVAAHLAGTSVGDSESADDPPAPPPESPPERSAAALLDRLEAVEITIVRATRERDSLVHEARSLGASWLDIARALRKPRHNIERKYSMERRPDGNRTK